jgi:hypothetical protein
MQKYELHLSKFLTLRSLYALKQEAHCHYICTTGHFPYEMYPLNRLPVVPDLGIDHKLKHIAFTAERFPIRMINDLPLR